MATAAAVVGAVVAVGGAARNRNAQKDAANDLKNANIEGANQLAEAGRLAEADILLAQNRALDSLDVGASEASARILPFVQPGEEAFRMAQDQILSGGDNRGALAKSISSAAIQGANPNIFDLSGPVGNEVLRQGDIAASGAQPIFTQGLLGAANQGVSAAGDVAGINQRALARTADIIGSAGAGRASVLVGQAPQLAQLSSGAQQGRLLADVVGQKFNTTAAETLAQLGGRLS